MNVLIEVFRNSVRHADTLPDWQTAQISNRFQISVSCLCNSKHEIQKVEIWQPRRLKDYLVEFRKTSTKCMGLGTFAAKVLNSYLLCHFKDSLPLFQGQWTSDRHDTNLFRSIQAIQWQYSFLQFMVSWLFHICKADNSNKKNSTEHFLIAVRFTWLNSIHLNLYYQKIDTGDELPI